MGYIKLACPVTHVWYLKRLPSYIANLLDKPLKELEGLVYCDILLIFKFSIKDKYYPINNEPNGRKINVIAGGFGTGGESNQSRRDYARRVHQVERPPAPRPTPYPSPAHARFEGTITFSDNDLVGVTTPHTDALVIAATINHCTV
ncbi:hypothetical protein Taro_013946 [Colocasia esculenta]|uniref:DNA-directed RNA polymerase n=1 Tax=Colocasia esculenta TaxID=4460 RepID=A0A843UHK4_COLES|nr:hypothetical protein [Colocasia esculenta]